MTKLTVLLLNAAVVIAGSLIGSNLKKVIRKDVLDGVMIGIGVVMRGGQLEGLSDSSVVAWDGDANSNL